MPRPETMSCTICQSGKEAGRCFYVGFFDVGRYVWICDNNPDHFIEGEGKVCCPFCGQGMENHAIDPRISAKIEQKKLEALPLPKKIKIALEVLRQVAFQANSEHDSSLCEATSSVMAVLSNAKVVKLVFEGETKEVQLFRATAVILLFQLAFGYHLDIDNYCFKKGEVSIDPLSEVYEEGITIVAERNPNIAVVA